MEIKEKYQISNFQAAAQLGALAGQIQALIITEPRPTIEQFVTIQESLVVLSQMCEDLHNAIEEKIHATD